MDANGLRLKTTIEAGRLRLVARFLRRLLERLATRIAPGVTPLDLERYCSDYLRRRSVVAEWPGYNGFGHVICVSVNSVAAHGVPTDVPFERGDIVTVDVGADIDGWKGDLAWSFLVGDAPPEMEQLRIAAWQASVAGAVACRPGNRIGDVGVAIGRVAKRFGCSVLREFTGHGIGHAIHEEPAVPHLGKTQSGPPILPGMVLNIEPVLVLGHAEVTLLPDGWSYVTTNGSPTAQFEHTVAVFRAGCEVLSLHASELEQRQPPF